MGLLALAGGPRRLEHGPGAVWKATNPLIGWFPSLSLYFSPLPTPTCKINNTRYILG